jgi:hypothetical protein
MKYFFYPLYLTFSLLTGCCTVDRMNALVNQSTRSIQENSEAIAASTVTIRENAYLVEQSSKAIETNRRLLEAESK